MHIVSTDHESVLKSDQLATHLNGKGIKIALRIPYEHEKTAERSMRVVREKMEAKISELPYNLPSDLYDYLAQQCNHMPNIHTTPTDSSRDSYRIQIQFSFGVLLVFRFLLSEMPPQNIRILATLKVSV